MKKNDQDPFILDKKQEKKSFLNFIFVFRKVRSCINVWQKMKKFTKVTANFLSHSLFSFTFVFKNTKRRRMFSSTFYFQDKMIK